MNKELLEIEKDKLLDEIEKINCLIYDNIKKIEDLENQIKNYNELE
jgi:hypothetical protein